MSTARAHKTLIGNNPACREVIDPKNKLYQAELFIKDSTLQLRINISLPEGVQTVLISDFKKLPHDSISHPAFLIQQLTEAEEKAIQLTIQYTYHYLKDQPQFSESLEAMNHFFNHAYNKLLVTDRLYFSKIAKGHIKFSTLNQFLENDIQFLLEPTTRKLIEKNIIEVLEVPFISTRLREIMMHPIIYTLISTKKLRLDELEMLPNNVVDLIKIDVHFWELIKRNILDYEDVTETNDIYNGLNENSIFIIHCIAFSRRLWAIHIEHPFLLHGKTDNIPTMLIELARIADQLQTNIVHFYNQIIFLFLQILQTVYRDVPAESKVFDTLLKQIQLLHQNEEENTNILVEIINLLEKQTVLAIKDAEMLRQTLWSFAGNIEEESVVDFHI